jgi:hypothetical protein
VKKAIVLGVCVAALAIGAVGEKRRVFVTQSESWEVKGRAGGAAPQTAEIIKSFAASCPDITVTNVREKADYIVQLDQRAAKVGRGAITKWPYSAKTAIWSTRARRGPWAPA